MARISSLNLSITVIKSWGLEKVGKSGTKIVFDTFHIVSFCSTNKETGVVRVSLILSTDCISSSDFISRFQSWQGVHLVAAKPISQIDSNHFSFSVPKVNLQQYSIIIITATNFTQAHGQNKHLSLHHYGDDLMWPWGERTYRNDVCNATVQVALVILDGDWSILFNPFHGQWTVKLEGKIIQKLFVKEHFKEI